MIALELLNPRVHKLVNFQTLPRGKFLWAVGALELRLVNRPVVVECAFFGGAIIASLEVTG